MNCAIVFGLLLMYSSVASNPASSLAAAAEVYYHFPTVHLRRSLPVKCHDTWFWNPPPRTQPMWGVANQVSVPKISTNWTTDLKKNPDTRGTTPSNAV